MDASFCKCLSVTIAVVSIYKTHKTASYHNMKYIHLVVFAW